MKSALLTPGPVRPAKNDPAVTALLHSLNGDNATLLQSIGAFLESRGVAPPWAVPASISLQDFMAAHAARKSKKLSAGAYVLLKRVLTDFVVAHKGLALDAVTGQHLQSWQDGLVGKGLSSGSVRNQMAVLGGAFTRAVALGHLRVNPCAAVEGIESGGVVSREPMSDVDFGKLTAWLKSESRDEWWLCSHLCRYAGLRLGDAARLDASAIRIEGEATLLALVVAKTAKPSVTPVFSPLDAILRGLAVTGGPVCPSLAKLPACVLSRQFAGFLEAAGIDPLKVTLPNGRVHARIGAHSLRHSYVTDMARRGIPQHLRQKMAAHSTSASHALYDHTGAVELHAQVSRYFNAA